MNTGRTAIASQMNVMEILVADRDTDSSVQFNEVMLNGQALGDFSTDNVGIWGVTGFDFGQGFTLSGKVVISGPFSNSQEKSRVDIKIGTAPLMFGNYQVGKLTIVKQSSLTEPYEFTSTIPGYETFSLTPNTSDNQVMAMVAGGTYTISEVVESFPQNVIFIGGSCVDANAGNAPVQIDLSFDPPRIVVPVAAGQDVVCTLLNEPTTSEDEDGGEVSEGGDHKIYLPFIVR